MDPDAVVTGGEERLRKRLSMVWEEQRSVLGSAGR